MSHAGKIKIDDELLKTSGWQELGKYEKKDLVQLDLSKDGRPLGLVEIKGAHVYVRANGVEKYWNYSDFVDLLLKGPSTG